ncbi:MAG: hypothetical protein WB808_11945 [Candidatus Dormiibacterota bacterium]
METTSGGPDDKVAPRPRGRLEQAVDILENGPNSRRTPQVMGNLILTSHAGLIILFALVLLYLSGLAFTPLRPVHFALGFALIPILAVKLASTSWRAISYYLRRGAYRAAGPPWVLPRLIAAPLAVAAVLATVSGVVLWSQGTDHGAWAGVHTDSVIALGVIVLVHLAVYLRKALRASAKSLTATAINRPERVIVWALLAALVAGAIATGLEPTWNPSAAATPPPATQP